MSLYPLKFKPWFLEKIWGGRKIETVLGKSLPVGLNIGESWELYDFPPGVSPAKDRWISSVVDNGALAGRTIHELVTEFGAELLGDVSLAPQGQFPILIKFLDASEDLSVQVHPDQKYVDEHSGAFLKNEVWYVIQADKGAQLLKGLRPGVTRRAFESAIKNGAVESMINTVDVKQGQSHYLPSGLVHALKKGILAAEIQTPSDTTFRLYDYDRVDQSTGKPRQLHVDQAIACIDFSGNPDSDSVKRISEYFTIKQKSQEPSVVKITATGRPVVWIVLEGEAQIKGEATEIRRGDTLLFPAEMKPAMLTMSSRCEWLEVTFPAKKT